jgi:hypothetical protein
VAIRVDSANAKDRRQILAQYEDIFSAWPLATRYLLPDAPVLKGTQLIIDGREDFSPPAFVSDGGAIPDVVRSTMPLSLSKDYRASYTWSQDRQTLLAYVYNATAHLECPHHLGGRFHRLPRQTPLEIRLQHFPTTNLTTQVYNLTSKTRLLKEGFSREWSLDLGKTDGDFFVLVTPR